MPIILMLAMAGCASLPAGVSRPEPKPIEMFATQRSFISGSKSMSEWPQTTWWVGYGDTQLTTLITEALATSPDLAAVQARFLRASATTETARGASFPIVTGASSINAIKQSANQGIPPEFVPQGYNDTGRATLDLSYELDFWGRNRAALAAATSDMEAARADSAAATLALATGIASTYGELGRYYADDHAARQALKIRSETRTLIAARERDGLENLGTLKQSDAAVHVAEANVAATGEQIALTRNRLAALMGAGPDRGLEISEPKTTPLNYTNTPRNLAADLLGRRADIVASRLRVEAAAKRIKVAKTAFYPNVNLSAMVGVQSLFISNLLAAGSGIGSIGPALHLPIFDGGRLQGQYRSAEASYAEAVANYNATLGQALKDVADALTSKQALAVRLSASRAALDAASAAYTIARLRYTGGLSPYIAVLNAEDTLVNTQAALADLDTRAFALDVALVRALGGGYADSKTNSSQVTKDKPHGR